jgi:hypothetical protein
MTRNDPERDPLKTPLMPLEAADLRFICFQRDNPITDFWIMTFRFISFRGKALAPRMRMVDAQVTPARLTQFLEKGEKFPGSHRELLGTAALVGGASNTVDVFSRTGKQTTALQRVSMTSMLDHLLQNPRIDPYGGHTLIRASSAGQHQW